MTALANWRKVVFDSRVWLLFLSLQIPSLRALAKYVPPSLWPLIPLYLIVTWLLYADLLHDGLFVRILKRIGSRAWFVIVLLIMLFAIQAVVYPHADARKFQGPSTPQDDALVVGGEYLANGLNPYEALTFRREYVSAGPGWILLALPFTLTGAIGFFNPVWIAISAFIVWRIQRNAFHASLFLVLLMSSLAFWELTVSGSDMLSIGCALLVSTIFVHRVWNRISPTFTGGNKGGRGARGGGLRLLSVVLLACSVTSRIVFAYAIPLLAGFLGRRSWKTSITFFVIAGGLTAALHLFFYLWNPPAYFPLTRFSDPSFLPGILWPLIAALASLLMFVVALRRADDTLASWLFNFWLALAVVMFLSAFGDLAARQFNLADWEGANYLGVVMPLFVAWIVFAERAALSPPESE